MFSLQAILPANNHKIMVGLLGFPPASFSGSDTERKRSEAPFGSSLFLKKAGIEPRSQDPQSCILYRPIPPKLPADDEVI
jgi:hypothetical protein